MKPPNKPGEKDRERAERLLGGHHERCDPRPLCDCGFTERLAELLQAFADMRAEGMRAGLEKAIAIAKCRYFTEAVVEDLSAEIARLEGEEKP